MTSASGDRSPSVNDPGGLCRALTPFDAAEIATLTRFLAVARRLTKSPLFAPGNGVGVNLFADGVEPFAPVDETQTNALLLDFRQLYRHGEECSYYVVADLIGKHSTDVAEGTEIRQWLKELKRAHKDRLKHGSGFTWSMLSGNQKTGTSAELLDDWFNGEVFHGNPEHGARHQQAAQDETLRTELLTTVQALTEVYVVVARMVKAILAEECLRA